MNLTPGNHNLGGVVTTAAPVQTAALTAGMGNCNNSNERLVAVLNVVGVLSVKVGSDAYDFREFGAFVALGTRMRTFLTSAVTGQRVMTPVAPLSCNAAAAPGYCRSNWVKHDFGGSPGKAVLIAEPSTAQYLDFFGSIFDVQWAPGGLI